MSADAQHLTRARFAELERRLAAVTEQRDALLDALKASVTLAEWLVYIGGAEGPIATKHIEEAAYRHKSVIDQARAAIAKVQS